MSKFIDSLNRLSRGEHQPIGFGIRKSDSPVPKIQLVVGMDQDSDTGEAAGADAVMLRISGTGNAAESLKSISEALPGVPAGVRLDSGAKAGVKQLDKAGCDFLTFPAAGTPLATIGKDETGRIIEVDSALNDGLIRTLNDIPADAVLVAGEGSLTWQQLMVFQRFSSLLTKPLLASVPAKVTGAELLALWEAGISGVVVESGDGVKKLRQEIDKLDFPPQRRREKSEALLPRTGRETGALDMEEDDDY
jgi:hypothetical protein